MILYKNNIKLKTTVQTLIYLESVNGSKITKNLVFGPSNRKVFGLPTFFSCPSMSNKYVFAMDGSTKNYHTLSTAKSTSAIQVDPPYKKREKKRRHLILPKHIGRVFLVHNGKTFSSIHISRKMLGHKFGEFASTRKKPLHKKKR